MTREEKKKINAYIQYIEDNDKIFDKENEAFKNAGSWGKFFGNNNDIVLEIGTGMGHFFSLQAAAHPDKNYIGKEIRFKRLHTTADKSTQLGANNFALVCTKGENITKTFADGELSQTYIFFPDPWANKDRQRKHRLIQKGFLENLYQKTKLGGKLFFKTDHREYFESSLEILKELPNWKIIEQSFDYEQESEVFDTQKMTEFEHIFRRNRLEICYVVCEKI